MIGYSVLPRDQIFVKGYRLLSFAKNMGKNIGKNISKNVNGKYSPDMLATRHKLFEYAKQFTTDAFKTTSKKSNSKNSRSNW